MTVKLTNLIFQKELSKRKKKNNAINLFDSH